VSSERTVSPPVRRLRAVLLPDGEQRDLRIVDGRTTFSRPVATAGSSSSVTATTVHRRPRSTVDRRCCGEVARREIAQVPTLVNIEHFPAIADNAGKYPRLASPMPVTPWSGWSRAVT
jgi:hypothetical protein